VSLLPPPADKLKAEVEQYMSQYDRKVEEVIEPHWNSYYCCWLFVRFVAGCCIWSMQTAFCDFYAYNSFDSRELNAAVILP